MGNAANKTSDAVRTKRFETWTLSQSGYASERRAVFATELDQAASAACPPMMPASLAPKGGFPSFVILAINDGAREGDACQTLHFYTVKVRREYRCLNGSPMQAAIPYAVHAGSLPMNNFEPRRPFRAGIDDTLNGRQPGEGRLIEVSPNSLKEQTL